MTTPGIQFAKLGVPPTDIFKQALAYVQRHFRSGRAPVTENETQ